MRARSVAALFFALLAAVSAMVVLIVAGALPPDLGVRTLAGWWPEVARFNPWAPLLALDPLPRAGVAAGAGLLGVAACRVALGLGLSRDAGGDDVAPGLHLVDVRERGHVLVDSRAIDRVATETAQRVRGVASADVQVSSRGAERVALTVNVGALPGLDLRAVGSDVRDAVHGAVETLAGVRVVRADVRTHLLTPRQLRRLRA